MDIHEILGAKIKALPAGPHADGLRAVKSHIDTAVRHLMRGQNEPDQSLFTDVIFRCNQAFEGSIKEAYRVLANQDPRRKTPAEIEKFLATGNLLRKKVLDQFTNYRTEWRNPSTHDYTLDFDEDEALLAIVSVTAFAIVLCDQIDGKLAFNAAAASSPVSARTKEQDGPLVDLVTAKVLLFAKRYEDSGTVHQDVAGATGSVAHSYFRFEGALAGYLSAELTDVTVEQSHETMIGLRADVLVKKGHERVAVEVKQVSRVVSGRGIQGFASSASNYLLSREVSGVVGLIYAIGSKDYAVVDAGVSRPDMIRIIAAPTQEFPELGTG